MMFLSHMFGGMLLFVSVFSGVLCILLLREYNSTTDQTRGIIYLGLNGLVSCGLAIGLILI